MISTIYFGDRKLHELSYHELVSFYYKTVHDLDALETVVDKLHSENEAKGIISFINTWLEDEDYPQGSYELSFLRRQKRRAYAFLRGELA